LCSVLDEMLAFFQGESSREPPILAEVDLSQVARSVVDIASLSFRARPREGQIRLDGVDAPVKVTTDAGKVRQILINLVSNAVKYGGPDPVDLVLTEGEETVEIGVRDLGPGIPAERIEEIFQPFHRLDGVGLSTEGSGLGLAICRRLARALEGDVVVESVLGE